MARTLGRAIVNRNERCRGCGVCFGGRGHAANVVENTLVNKDGTPVIFRVTVNDWRAFRTLRLEALRLEPSAFSSIYADAILRPDTFWTERLTSERNIDLAARAGNRLVGMVGAWFPPDPEDESIAIVISMYVPPEFRGTGLARRLLEALIEQIATRPGIQTIRLWVNQEREPARRLYTSVGFRVISSKEAANGVGPVTELVMERPVR